MRAFTFLLFIFSLPALAENYRAMGPSAGFQASKTLPNSPPFNTVAELRIEARVSDWTASNFVFQIGAVQGFVHQVSPLQLRATNGALDIYLSPLTVPTSTSILMRVQRSVSNQHLMLEVWSADGNTYLGGTSQSVISSPINLSSAVSTIFASGHKLDWVRAYDNTLPYQSAAPPSNVVESSGVLLNYECEGNVNDSGPHAQHLSIDSGTPTWTTTPAVPLVGEDRTVRAGHPFTLDCGASGASSYFWQQLSGPVAVFFSDRAAANPTITGADVFGQYEFQCSATWATPGLTATSVLRVGAVPTNAAGVVIPPSERIAHILGPMLRSDASPWPYYDKNRRRRGLDVFQALVPTLVAAVNTPLAGTVSINNGSTTVTGSGTSFTSTMTVSGFIIIYYNKGGGNFGRVWRQIASIQSDTQLTVTGAWNRSNQSAVQHQFMVENNNWVGDWNFYEAVYALYVTYYKTGLSKFAEMADTLAGLWMHWTDGYILDFITSPRNASLDGIMLAAERGVVNSTDAYNYAQAYSWPGDGSRGYNHWIHNRTRANGAHNLWYGPRESGYTWRFATSLARLHPSSTERSNWESRLSTNIVDVVREMQCKSSNPDISNSCLAPAGAFRVSDPGALPISEQPWHTALFMHGVVRYHRWTGNSTAATVITDWVNHLLTNTQPGGQAPDNGLWLGEVTSGVPPYKCGGFYEYFLLGNRTTPDPANGFNRCETSIFDPNNLRLARDTAHTMMSTMGYAYRLTGNQAIKTRGDQMFGFTFGGTDPFVASWNAPFTNHPRRFHNQALCCSDSYLVDRLTAAEADITPADLALRFAFRKENIPGTQDVRLTLTRPDGSQQTATCSSSPCSLTGNRIQGQHRIVMEYLSSSGAVLARSESTAAAVTP